MLFKKYLILAIVQIICKETGPKINMGGEGGARSRDQGTGIRKSLRVWLVFMV
jgi:hypothetical protein